MCLISSPSHSPYPFPPPSSSSLLQLLSDLIKSDIFVLSFWKELRIYGSLLELTSTETTSLCHIKLANYKKCLFPFRLLSVISNRKTFKKRPGEAKNSLVMLKLENCERSSCHFPKYHENYIQVNCLFVICFLLTNRAIFFLIKM